MDFNFFFRRFFGTPRDPDRNFHDPFDEPEDYENEKKDDPFYSMFPNSHGSFERETFDVFQHMEDMFSRMFSASFGPLAIPNFEEIISQENDPRSLMLKEPADDNELPSVVPSDGREQPNFVDSDIDDKVARQGLFREFQEKQVPQKFSYRKFSSIRTVHLPDGTIEEHRTFTDSDGNKVTKVRRSIGDQSHEVITHSDIEGLKEKEENLINIDENALSEFEKRWKSMKNGTSGTLPSNSLETTVPTVAPPAGDSSYLHLFKKFFGSPSESK